MGEGDRHEGGGVKGRQKVWDEAGFLKMIFNSGDFRSSMMTDGMSIDEEAQERKRKCGCEEKHREGSLQMMR